MFDGFTAWFSSSVEESRINQWIDSGGLIASSETADYIFSQDATCNDTTEIFESEAYLDEHLSVFHPEYISACVRKKSRDSVNIGKYFFPPAEVQEYMRGEGQVLEWEKENLNARTDTNKDNQHQRVREENDRRQSQDQQKVTSSSKKHQQPCTSTGKTSPHKTLTFSKQTEPEIGKDNTDISDMPPEESGLEKHMKNTENRMNEKKERRKGEKMNKSLNDSRRTRQHEQNASIREQATTLVNDVADETDVPHNNIVTERKKREPVYYWNDSEVLRLKDLAKVSGKLVAFDTGEDGCEFVDFDEE